jgi:hypothetical protein
MRHRIRAVIGGLIAALLLPLLILSPARASHDFDHGRWNRAPYIAWDGQNAGNIQDGAYYWQDRGFDGYQYPLPQWSHGGAQCATVWNGWINVCTVSRSIASAYCGENCDGYTYVANNWPSDIYGAFVLIASDLSPSRRQAVWRHEMGHALGLGHTADWETTCVMQRFTPVLGETCKHDRDALNLMYPGKRF